MLTTLLSFAVVIGIVIFVHELGHFLAAKASGIRVERFSLGYPPRMVGKKVGETDYCISWIPFGGYVKMSGMIDESAVLSGRLESESVRGWQKLNEDLPAGERTAQTNFDLELLRRGQEAGEKGLSDLDRQRLDAIVERAERTVPPKPWEFMAKNTGQKALVITAGVLMNFVLAAVVYTTVTLSEGIPYVQDPVVAAISPGMPADGAGIQVGDRILSINQQGVDSWDQMVEIIHDNPEHPIVIRWEHEGETREAEITPKRQKTQVDGDIKEVGLIGISPRFSYRPAKFFEAISTGAQLTAGNIELGLKSLGMLVTGRASIRELGGPIAIAKWSGESARGGIASFVLFIAFISINIGLLNLLPVPALDGGHLAIIVIEGISRRRISHRAKGMVQQVGMVLLLGLMAVVIFNDLGRVGVWEKIRGLF